MQADVKESFSLPNAAGQLFTLQKETFEVCQRARNEAAELFDETQREEQNSLQMLNVAREVEQTAHAAMTVAEGVLLAAEARLAEAVAEEAAAVSSVNPLAALAATENLFSAQQAYQRAREAYDFARQAYEAAKAHRELLEKRYEMAQRAVNLAEIMKSKLEVQCVNCLAKISPLVEQGSSRIMQAHEDLQKYHAQTSSVANLPAANVSRHSTKKSTATKTSDGQFQTWENYQPKLGEPVNPQEINARLNPSKEVLRGLLESRYRNDPKFKAQVDSYREQAKTNRAAVEEKIKRNMVGNFAEEIVKHALKPYGGVYRTQERVDLPNGSYTKPDFILHDLKVPLIVGKGEGMGVRENRSIGIEVKTGQANYILSQRDHLETQAQGHVQCDASWTICTRDVQKIETDKQRDLRSAIREAGSPIVGFLPYKDELDAVCMNFVFGETT